MPQTEEHSTNVLFSISITKEELGIVTLIVLTVLVLKKIFNAWNTRKMLRNLKGKVCKQLTSFFLTTGRML